MNRLEQRIREAAPPPSPAVFPLDVKTELEMIANRADGVELISAPRPAARGMRPRKWPKTAAFFPAIVAAAALWLAAIPSHPPEAPQSAGDGGILGPLEATGPTAQPAPGESTAPYSSWRTAFLSRPWTDAPVEVIASVEMPAEWNVVRHNISTDYPGLHVTIVDQDSLPVAMLYFGPLPAAAACRTSGGQHTELERIATKSGAELLDPSLAMAFSYAVSAGPEPRGSFSLLPLTPRDGLCGPFRETSEPPVILDFSDVLNLGTYGGSEPPRRSSYARSFPTANDARQYLKSAEYNALKRMITSLGFSFPSNAPATWQVPNGVFQEHS